VWVPVFMNGQGRRHHITGRHCFDCCVTNHRRSISLPRSKTLPMFFSLLLRCRRRGNGFKSTAAPTAAHFIHSVEKELQITPYHQKRRHKKTRREQAPMAKQYDRKKHIKRYEATWIHMTRELSQAKMFIL